MARKEKNERNGFVEGHDERIGKDDHAGMPKEVIMKDYPRSRMLRGGELDDSISDIDDIEGQSTATADKNISYQK